MNGSSGESAILATFANGTPALFATEVRAALGPALAPAAFERALAELVARGRVVVVANAAPDPHLADVDLRIVAPASRRCAGGDRSGVARLFLRDFLSSHRCS